MKLLRVRFPIRVAGQASFEVTGVLKVPRKFTVRRTPAVVLAHGASGGVDDPVLAFVQAFLVGRGFLTLGFNFPYREQGRRAPDRDHVLEAAVQSAVDFVRQHPSFEPGNVFIGGRSMGGRIASHLAAANREMASGLVLLAYPLHPPGRPDRARDQHLSAIDVPTLFVSGSRDALAPRDSLKRAVKGVPRAHLVWIEGADHSFNMMRKSGVSAEDVWHQIADTVANWLDAVFAARIARPNAPLVSSRVPVVGEEAGQESPDSRIKTRLPMD